MKKIPTPEQIAQELVNVQPMPSDCIKNLHDASMDTKQLMDSGYEPVSGLGLVWMKKEKKE